MADKSRPQNKRDLLPLPPNYRQQKFKSPWLENDFFERYRGLSKNMKTLVTLGITTWLDQTDPQAWGRSALQEYIRLFKNATSISNWLETLRLLLRLYLCTEKNHC